jgi:hypothetical protein
MNRVWQNAPSALPSFKPSFFVARSCSGELFGTLGRTSVTRVVVSDSVPLQPGGLC